MTLVSRIRENDFGGLLGRFEIKKPAPSRFFGVPCDKIVLTSNAFRFHCSLLRLPAILGAEKKIHTARPNESKISRSSEFRLQRH